MNRIATIAVIGIAVALCAGAASAQVQVLKKIEYAAQTGASRAVKEECKLDTSIPEALAAASSEIKLVNKFGGGKRLELLIRDVHAPGGGIFSGPKWVRIDGELKSGGKLLGSFRANRNTVTGGSTCGMLERCVKAIAKDVSDWMASPSVDARLGNAK